jgi:N-acetylglutamate synthase-like GNAT family acetyltransferase
MIPEAHIREANSADVSLLSGLIRESFGDVAGRFGLTLENCPKHPSHCTDDWIENDFARGVTYYILESNSTAVGCVGLEKANSDFCYLERLGVLPQARRKGFGRALVDHVISQANLYGAKQISIGIIADDTQLRRWYQRIGFIEGETKEFDHLPFRVTFMTYEL